MHQQTLVFCKPDAVEENLVGRIINQLEVAGFRLCAAKMVQLTRLHAAEHYGEHRGQDWYPRLIEFSISGPILAMVWSGAQAIAGVRRLVGATDPNKAAPDSIRGSLIDFTTPGPGNLVHSSDSPEAAVVEIRRFFAEWEILRE